MGWLSGADNFVRERVNLVLNSFRSFTPMKRFQYRSGVLEFKLCSKFDESMLRNSYIWHKYSQS